MDKGVVTHIGIFNTKTSMRYSILKNALGKEKVKLPLIKLEEVNKEVNYVYAKH